MMPVGCCYRKPELVIDIFFAHIARACPTEGGILDDFDVIARILPLHLGLTLRQLGYHLQTTTPPTGLE